MAPRTLTHDEQLNAVKTWRYLRLAIVGLVIGLAVALMVEHGKVDCFQGSISAYYYTPVRGYFVGALLGIGVCLFCLRGSTPGEDVLLNLAGMGAAVVALVPTPHIGACRSAPSSAAGRAVNVDNNVKALLAVGAFAVLVFAVLAVIDAVRSRRDGGGTPASSPSILDLIGFVAASAALVVAWRIFDGDRGAFLAHAHDAAAIGMFACIFVVVVLNAIAAAARGRRRLLALYAAVAVAMVAAGVMGVVGKVQDWGHWVLMLETALIALFAIFWLLQTIELWNQGLRHERAR